MRSGPVAADEKDAPLPPGIEETMELLREGIDNETLMVLRQRMNDTGEQIVYDLVVARPVSNDDMTLVSIARLFPQLQEEEKVDPASFEAPARLS